MRTTFIGPGAGMLAALALILAACGGDEPAVIDATAAEEPAATEAAVEQEPAPTEAATGQEPAATEAAAGQESGVVDGVATLAEQNGSGVSGEATLRWDPDTSVMSVAVEVDGLEDGAMYRAVIASGCQPPMQRIHALGGVTGGPDGTGQVTAEVTDVETVDLDGGWTVVVARPQVGPQACGELGPS